LCKKNPLNSGPIRWCLYGDRVRVVWKALALSHENGNESQQEDQDSAGHGYDDGNVFHNALDGVLGFV
jgi:hypothetical protein